MSKKPQTSPVDQTGRLITLGIGVLFLAGIIALVAFSFIRQNAPVSVSPTASPTASPIPRPRETPGTYFKSQGHPGHDKKGPSDVASFVYNSDPPTSCMHLE